MPIYREMPDSPTCSGGSLLSWFPLYLDKYTHISLSLCIITRSSTPTCGKLHNSTQYVSNK